MSKLKRATDLALLLIWLPAAATIGVLGCLIVATTHLALWLGSERIVELYYKGNSKSEATAIVFFISIAPLLVALFLRFKKAS